MDADATIVSRSLTHPDVFGEIFERHHTTMWRYLARVGGRQAADDLAGQVFVSAFESRHRFDPHKGSVRSWLYGIASNLVRSRFRSEQRARRALDRVGVETATIDPMEVVAEVDALRRESSQVRQALADLPAEDCEIIVLAAWEELTYRQIGSVLDIPVGTVRSRLSRARSRLRELLPETGEVLDRPPSRS